MHELTLVRFILEIKVKDKRAGSWENVLSYEKGNFRFIGAGAWPFWTWEDSSDGLGIFVKRGRFNWPLEVIHQVPPEYPQSARQKHIQGVVELAITVDKMGW